MSIVVAVTRRVVLAARHGFFEAKRPPADRASRSRTPRASLQ